jgi:hypothetical protein
MKLGGHESGPESPGPAFTGLPFEIQRSEWLKNITEQESHQRKHSMVLDSCLWMWWECHPLTSSLNPRFPISQRWWPRAQVRPVETYCSGIVVTHIQSLVSVSSLPLS